MSADTSAVHAEQWRPVPDFPGYFVNRSGQVLSRKYRTPRILRPRPDRHGYEMAHLSRGPLRKNAPVHALVAQVFLGARPPGMEVRHLDGDCRNNHVENLAYGTSSDNKRDQLRHGTHHQAKKTHCRHGHPFDAANTSVHLRKNGVHQTRRCRACDRAAAQRLRDRRREERSAQLTGLVR